MKKVWLFRIASKRCAMRDGEARKALETISTFDVEYNTWPGALKSRDLKVLHFTVDSAS